MLKERMRLPVTVISLPACVTGRYIEINQENGQQNGTMKSFILPQFAHKDKVTIIEADAFDFMTDLADGEYDFCFADIWRSYEDIVPYHKMKGLCQKFRQMTCSYWIEDALKHTTIQYVYFLMYAEAYNQNIDIQSDLQEMPEDTARILNFLGDLLKNEEITKPEQVDYYLDVNYS